MQAIAAAGTGSPLLVATGDAHWIGTKVRDGEIKGTIASLSPERLVDSGAPLDRRFVTGPFIFRMKGLLTSAEERSMNVVTRSSFAQAFAVSPPGAIITGGQRHSTPAAPAGVDEPLDRWTRSRGYQAEQSPSGLLTLYLPPSR